MKSRYSMFLRWSEEDDAWIVTVPELPGCKADGKTPKKALKHLKKVIRLWLNVAAKEGRAWPEPSKWQLVSVDGKGEALTVQT